MNFGEDEIKWMIIECSHEQECEAVESLKSLFNQEKASGKLS